MAMLWYRYNTIDSSANTCNMNLTVHLAGRSGDPSNSVLALDIGQAMIVGLLPAAVRMLGEILYPAQPQEKNARFRAYKGVPLWHKDMTAHNRLLSRSLLTMSYTSSLASSCHVGCCHFLSVIPCLPAF